MKNEQLEIGYWYLVVNADYSIYKGIFGYCKYVGMVTYADKVYGFRLFNGHCYYHIEDFVKDYIEPCSTSFSEYLDLFAMEDE